MGKLEEAQKTYTFSHVETEEELDLLLGGYDKAELAGKLREYKLLMNRGKSGGYKL